MARRGARSAGGAAVLGFFVGQFDFDEDWDFAAEIDGGGGEAAGGLLFGEGVDGGESSAALLVLLFWSGPMRWKTASVRGRTRSALDCISCTRFSPKWRWPAA